MILHFVKIMGLQRFPKTYHGQCPSKTIVYTKVFWGGGGGGGGGKKLSKKISVWWVQNRENFEIFDVPD